MKNGKDDAHFWAAKFRAEIEASMKDQAIHPGGRDIIRECRHKVKLELLWHEESVASANLFKPGGEERLAEVRAKLTELGWRREDLANDE
jgi:hypothetical protein